MSKNKTTIAVLMAAYNAEETLSEAVNSVLKCPLPIRLFIVDDASTKSVSEVLEPDDRIFVLRLEKNSGLPAALNHGLKVILEQDFTYVARMDADDVCLPGRFEKQLEFMENNKDIALVGCWARFFDDKTGQTRMYYSPPTTPESIKNKMFFNSAVCHPTWFMRAHIFGEIGLYNTDYDTAQDYDFLSRVISRYKAANIPEYLLDYRVSDRAISQMKRKRQLVVRFEVQRKMFVLLNWRSYAGLTKTMILKIVPVSLLARIKSVIYKKST